MPRITKARFWVGVLYPENMRDGWEDDIGDVIQNPYAYCCHTRDKDTKSEHRKDHVHLMIAFPNTTTYNHAMNVFDLLSADGKKALNKIEACAGVRNVYDYLIHDTDNCRKKGKELYSPSERITGNNFDIGAYEQLDAAKKEEIIQDLNRAVREQGFTNFMDLFIYVDDNFEDSHYAEVLRTNSAWYERLTRGNYQRWEQGKLEFPSQARCHSVVMETMETCCPDCGSIAVVKNGKTAAESQIWKCKDCGKRFV